MHLHVRFSSGTDHRATTGVSRRLSENTLGGRISRLRAAMIPEPKPTHSILFSYDGDDVAAQLTLTEAEHFAAIQVSEFPGDAWQDPKMCRSRAPSLSAMVEFFQSGISNRVDRKGSTRSVGPGQAEALERAIAVAEGCHALRNYNAFMEVHLALSQARRVPARGLGARFVRSTVRGARGALVAGRQLPQPP